MGSDSALAKAEAEAIPPLVGLLRSGSEETKAEAAMFLANLAAVGADNKIFIAKAEAIPLLVGLLRSESEEAKANAALALANLAVNDADNKISIAKAEAIPPLVGLLRFGSEKAKANAALALTALASHVDNRIPIAKAEAIPPLVGLLRSGSEEAKAKAYAASVLLQLRKNAKFRAQIDDALNLQSQRQRKISEQLEEEDHFVLSVKFTKGRCGNDSADIIEEILNRETRKTRKYLSNRTYNPNNYNKTSKNIPSCKGDGSCRGRCQTFETRIPEADDCWASSYRWHLDEDSTRAKERNRRRPIMLQLLEDKKLGDGQKWEEEMARELGVRIVTINWSGFEMNQAGNMRDAVMMVLEMQLREKLGPYDEV